MIRDLRELFQRERLAPHGLRKPRCGQRLRSLLLCAVKLGAARQAVDEHFPTLRKSGADHREEHRLALHLHRRLLPKRKPDDRRAHIRPRHETILRDVRRDVGVRVVLHRKGQRTVILAARTRLHALRDLALHHDGDVLHGDVLLEKPHDDRRRDIIGKICHYLERPPAALPHESVDVRLQNVIVDDREIVVIAACVLAKDRDEVLVDLDRNDLLRPLAQHLRHRADAGPDLEHNILLRHARRVDDLVEHVRVDQKILPEFLLKHKMIFLQDRDRLLRVA